MSKEIKEISLFDAIKQEELIEELRKKLKN